MSTSVTINYQANVVYMAHCNLFIRLCTLKSLHLVFAIVIKVRVIINKAGSS